jgi:hypothetical protein
MSKMGLHDHLTIYNTNYGWKKGQKSKCQLDSQPLKVGNRLELCVCRRCVTYLWKNFDEGYNFALNLTSIRTFHKKLWTSKVVGVSISRIVGSLTWDSWGKCHLDVAFMACHRKYYKGEGGGFPQIWTVVSFMNPYLPTSHMCTKNVATPLWPSVGVKPNTWKSWRLRVFRDSWMFRAQQKGPKHLALGCSWCH